MRFARLAPLLLLALILAPPSTAGAGGHEPDGRSPRGPRAGAPKIRVGVLPLTVLDNSMNGDSEQLQEWLLGKGIDPTSTLRDVIVQPQTYSALEQPPTFVGVEP
ncbi:MAG: hypothetical protein H0V09_08035, partial [Gemmatimonadetes bacterium]|nr:hypothetical protein [Gemmatimonadota bacterium]